MYGGELTVGINVTSEIKPLKKAEKAESGGNRR